MSINIDAAVKDVVDFVESAAPNLPTELVSAANTAIDALKTALLPVTESAADLVVTFALSKVPGGVLDDAVAISFINGVIAKLEAKIPNDPIPAPAA